MTDSGSNNLAAMKLVELKSLAAGMGLKGVSAMRKGDLVAAIASGQGATRGTPAPKAVQAARSDRSASATGGPTSEKQDAGSTADTRGERRDAASGADRRAERRDAGSAGESRAERRDAGTTADSRTEQRQDASAQPAASAHGTSEQGESPQGAAPRTPNSAPRARAATADAAGIATVVSATALPRKL